MWTVKQTWEYEDQCIFNVINIQTLLLLPNKKMGLHQTLMQHPWWLKYVALDLSNTNKRHKKQTNVAISVILLSIRMAKIAKQNHMKSS